MSMAQHRVKSAFMGVTTPDHGFETIPSGAIIEIFEELNKPGLVPLVLDGKELLAFRRDIVERTERIEATRAM
jgi:hypothetical protein